MATFEVQLPEGTFEAQANSYEEAVRAAKAMAAQSAPPPPAAEPPPTGFDPNVPGYVPPEAGGNDLSTARLGQLAGESMMRGAGNLAGLPVDLMTMILNTPPAVANMFLSEENEFPNVVDPATAVGGSEFIKSTAGDAARATGFPPIAEEDMSRRERVASRGVELATEAGIGSAGALASALGRAAGKAPGVIDDVLRMLTPREVSDAAPAAAGRILAGDVGAGAGAGIGLQGFEEFAPEEAQETLGLPGALMAALTGGVGGGVATGLTGAALSGAKNAVAPPPAPAAVNPQTGQQFPRAALDIAAMFMQDTATNPRLAARNIEDNAAAIRQFAPESAMPTAGALADDIGVAATDRRARTQDPVPAMERDAAGMNRAVELLESSAPPGAEGRDFTDAAARRAGGIRETVGRDVDKARGEMTALEMSRQTRGDALAERAADRPAAAQAIDETVFGTLERDRRTQSELRSKVDPNATVMRDAEPLQRAADEVEAGMAKVGSDPSRVAPSKVMDRIRQKAEFDPETGEMVSAGQVSVAEMNDMLLDIADDIRAERRSEQPSFRRIDNLRSLRQAILDDMDSLADEGSDAGNAARELRDWYNEKFAPVWNVGPGDEATKFRHDANKDLVARSTTPPSETAGRFLRAGSPEAAASLRRIVDASDNPAAGASAARQFLLADLASRGLVKADGGVDRRALARWRQRWGDEALETAAPGFTQELDDLARGAKRTEGKAEQLKADLRAAEEKAKLTERDINRGALGLVLDKSPENAVSSVFTSGDPQTNMRKLVQEVGSNERARNGLKAAVRDYLMDTATNAPGGLTETGKRGVSFARLSSLFEKHAKTMSEVYSPEEMNHLRQAHKLLEGQPQVRSAAATNRSPTAELQTQAEDRWRVLEAGLKLKFGVLKGGGLLRSIKIATASLPGGPAQQADAVIRQTMLDPELAAHMLRRDVDPASPAWNKKLKRLLAVQAAGQTAADDESE